MQNTLTLFISRRVYIDPLLSCQKYSKKPQFPPKKNYLSLSATHKIHLAFPIGTLSKRFMARKQHDYKSPIPISRRTSCSDYVGAWKGQQEEEKKRNGDFFFLSAHFTNSINNQCSGKNFSVVTRKIGEEWKTNLDRNADETKTASKRKKYLSCLKKKNLIIIVIIMREIQIKSHLFNGADLYLMPLCFCNENGNC